MGRVSGVGAGVAAAGEGVGVGAAKPQSFSLEGTTRHFHFTAFSNPGSMRVKVKSFWAVICADALGQDAPHTTKITRERAAPKCMALRLKLNSSSEAKVQ